MFVPHEQAAPDGSTVSQQARFQTEVLTTLMEHLLAADVLIGEQAALPVVAGGNAANITPNVCYLTARIVDKLWQGLSSLSNVMIGVLLCKVLNSIVKSLYFLVIKFMNHIIYPYNLMWFGFHDKL